MFASFNLKCLPHTKQINTNKLKFCTQKKKKGTSSLIANRPFKPKRNIPLNQDVMEDFLNEEKARNLFVQNAEDIV